MTETVDDSFSTLNNQMSLVVLVIGAWDLFVIWNLVLGVFSV